MSPLPANKTSFTEYLGRAVTLYAENFTMFINLSFACMAPTILKTLIDGTTGQGGMNLAGLLLGPLVFLVNTFFLMCLTYAVSSLSTGQNIAARDAMEHVKSRFLPGVGGYLLFSLLMLAGLFLLVLPGIYCFAVFYFFIFEILLEDKGVLASFKRSHTLAHHSFVRVLAAHALVFALTMLIFTPLLIGMKMLGVDNIVSVVVTGIAGGVTMPVFVIFYYFIYSDIKAAHDGALNIAVTS